MLFAMGMALKDPLCHQLIFYHKFPQCYLSQRNENEEIHSGPELPLTVGKEITQSRMLVVVVSPWVVTGSKNSELSSWHCQFATKPFKPHLCSSIWLAWGEPKLNSKAHYTQKVPIVGERFCVQSWQNTSVDQW